MARKTVFVFTDRRKKLQAIFATLRGAETWDKRSHRLMGHMWYQPNPDDDRWMCVIPPCRAEIIEWFVLR